MASFRSNLYSVSSAHEHLITIKECFTTCFQQLYRNFFQSNQVEKNVDSKNKKHVPFLQGLKLSSLKKTNDTLKPYFETVFSSSFQTPQGRNGATKKLEFITNLLSSTLVTANSQEIATETQAPPSGGNTDKAGCNMTILEDTFTLIREENPDLDAEIRGILIARAQTGATIGEIKEDYRKATGMVFPVFDHITDFLLCIPGVEAYCNERGTRIFNVRPTEKTKHIHNLVMNQKAPSERSSTSSYSNNFRRNVFHPRDSGFNSFRSNAAQQPMNQGFAAQQPMNQGFAAQPFQHQEPWHTIEEESVEKRNGYYRDNCQYLISRIYNGCEQNQTNAGFNANKNHFNHGFNTGNNNNAAQLDEVVVMDESNESEALPFRHQPTQNDQHVFKRPTGRAVRGIQASSPSGSRTNESLYSSVVSYEAQLLDFPLLGDDFFLYMARMELDCKFKKYEKVLQSGLCVSGQNIKSAIMRVSRLPYNYYRNRRVIINIGSVDIMQGKALVQIEHDYRNLINILNKRGLQPILTTLAPLANYSHDKQMKNKLERFNDFIKREGQTLIVIDIYSIFVNEKKQTLFDCYQNDPRQVTGAREHYVFWNKIGRQRVLQLIETYLEY